MPEAKHDLHSGELPSEFASDLLAAQFAADMGDFTSCSRLLRDARFFMRTRLREKGLRKLAERAFVSMEAEVRTIAAVAGKRFFLPTDASQAA